MVGREMSAVEAMAALLEMCHVERPPPAVFEIVYHQSPNLVCERYPSNLPAEVSPLIRVVAVGDRALSVDHVRAVASKPGGSS